MVLDIKRIVTCLSPKFLSVLEHCSNNRILAFLSFPILKVSAFTYVALKNICG